MWDLDVLDSGDDDLAREALALTTITLNAPVGGIPRGPALTLAPEATVAAAVEAMRRRARSAVVVVQQQRPLGVVTEGDILAQACADIDDLGNVPLAAVMTACATPPRASDSVGGVLRRMCALRLWHLPLVCARGLMVGSLDVTDLSLWLRDRMTRLSVDAAFSHAMAGQNG